MLYLVGLEIGYRVYLITVHCLLFFYFCKLIKKQEEVDTICSLLNRFCTLLVGIYKLFRRNI